MFKFNNVYFFPTVFTIILLSFLFLASNYEKIDPKKDEKLQEQALSLANSYIIPENYFDIRKVYFLACDTLYFCKDSFNYAYWTTVAHRCHAKMREMEKALTKDETIIIPSQTKNSSIKCEKCGEVTKKEGEYNYCPYCWKSWPKDNIITFSGEGNDNSVKYVLRIDGLKESDKELSLPSGYNYKIKVDNKSDLIIESIKE